MHKILTCVIQSVSEESSIFWALSGFFANAQNDEMDNNGIY